MKTGTKTVALLRKFHTKMGRFGFEIDTIVSVKDLKPTFPGRAGFLSVGKTVKKNSIELRKGHLGAIICPH